MRLDLGCGLSPREGFIGVDRLPIGDIQMDLDAEQWPWALDSVDEIWSSHTVEHIGDLAFFADQCWRVLKPGGLCTIVAPYERSSRAWRDPTHVRAINEESFLYWDAEWRRSAGVTGMVADFEILRVGFVWAPEWQRASDEARMRALRREFNVADDVICEMRKR